MRVSSHPAQVVTPNKDKERGSRFQILESPPKKKVYSLLKFPRNISLIHSSFIDPSFIDFDFLNSLFNIQFKIKN